MAGKIQNIKGTVDILPGESYRWQYLEDTIRKVMKQYNYLEMRTPVFEKTELFARGIGELTDIVSKEMYTFLDRGKKSLTLKPEMTAPIMRAYLQHNLQSSRLMNKIYYISPMFRQENPQAGRQRQFHQFGAEAIGSEQPEADAEIIMLSVAVFNALGLTELKLQINSLGDPAARKKYRAALQDFLRPNLPDLCQTCQSRFETNPLRILDCKNPACKEITTDAPLLIDFLDDDSLKHYRRVKEILDDNHIPYSENPKLVRGLDYYTHTVFEVTSTALGAQDAICGGGRYNLLAEELGGKYTPAVGFAAGMERTLMVMEKNGVEIPAPTPVDLYFVALGAGAAAWTQKQIYQLRRKNISCDTDFLNRSMKAQMREANKLNARYTVIIGDNELENGKAILKDMGDSGQVELDLNNFIAEVEKQIHG